MVMGFPSSERWMQCWGSWRSSVVPNTSEQWASAGEGWQHITWSCSIQMSKLECQSMVCLECLPHSFTVLIKNNSSDLQNVILKMEFGAQSGPCAVVFAVKTFWRWSQCAGIIREREGRYELKSPTLFIFGEKDDIIPLDQVSMQEL